MSANLPPHAPRKLLSLALVAVLGLPLVTATKRVRVQVDGGVRQVRSYADSVDELLARQGIDVSRADRVLPGRGAELVDGMRVRIVRAISVRLVAQDGSSREVLTPERELDGVMRIAGMGDAEPVRPFPGTLTDGDVIRIRIPVPVSVAVDGTRQVLHTTAATVADALAEAGIALGDEDVVTPAGSSTIDGPTTVEVTRIATRRETVDVPLPFEEERRETDELVRGRSRVVVEGVEGLRRDVFAVRVVDGAEASRELVSSEVVREPVTRVVEVGTRAPAPADDDGVWYRLARCESGARWSYDGTYDGGLQFHPDTWRRWKPSGYPAYAWQATAVQQITVGKRLHAARGWSPWPSCARKLGLA
jgi:uncharacterized protein YabE (DUF348 family)